MKASEIRLGSHFGTQLTAAITVCGCICLHLPPLFPPVTFPSIFSLGDGGNEQKMSLIGTVCSFNVFWRNSLP